MARTEPKKLSINDVQPQRIEEHFDLIMNDKSFVESEHSNVTFQNFPNWFDAELFKKGQNYYKNNVLGVTTGGLSGLMAVFLVPTISKILVFTKKSSTPCSAFVRYLETILHIHALYTQDFNDPNSKFWKSLNTIRWKHSNITKRLEKKEDHGILQKDMVLTQFGFIGYILANPQKLGLPDESTESEERKGFHHLWRVVGHLLGIPDEINLCRKNVEETTFLCKMILREVYGRYLDEPSQDFFDLVTATMTGLRSIDLLVDLKAFYIFLYDLHNKKYEGSLSWSNKFNANFRKFNFYLIRTPFIGFFVRSSWNIYFRVLIWCNERFPIGAWLMFGKSNSKINLYPALI